MAASATTSPASTLAAYTMVNLRATCALEQRWSLTGRIENLGDRDYELVHGYNTPGRSAFLEVIWQPRLADARHSREVADLSHRPAAARSCAIAGRYEIAYCGPQPRGPRLFATVGTCQNARPRHTRCGGRDWCGGRR